MFELAACMFEFAGRVCLNSLSVYVERVCFSFHDMQRDFEHTYMFNSFYLGDGGIWMHMFERSMFRFR